MKKVGHDELKRIAKTILAKLRTMSQDQVSSLFTTSDYHGFTVAEFPESFHTEVVVSHGHKPQDVEFEVIHVTQDLSHEVHLHRESDVLVLCLGSLEHFPFPKAARAYMGDGWLDAKKGDVFWIPAGTPHGFMVREGGILHLLSVQSPSTDGSDYVKIP